MVYVAQQRRENKYLLLARRFHQFCAKHHLLLSLQGYSVPSVFRCIEAPFLHLYHRQNPRLQLKNQSKKLHHLLLSHYQFKTANLRLQEFFPLHHPRFSYLHQFYKNLQNELPHCLLTWAQVKSCSINFDLHLLHQFY